MIRTAPEPELADEQPCRIIQLFELVEQADDPLTIPSPPPARRVRPAQAREAPK